MKIIYLLLLLINFSLQSQPEEEEHNPEDFYSVSNLYLNILTLDEGELIFYGDYGGILRTYDNGET